MTVRQLVTALLEACATERTLLAVMALLEADAGTTEPVCVQNRDIYSIHVEPAYYDGSYQVLERDMEVRHYNVVGARLVDQGTKIVIAPLSIESAINSDTELPVDFSQLKASNQGYYQRRVSGWRQQARARHQQRQNEHFAEYLLGRLRRCWPSPLDEAMVQATGQEFAARELPFNEPLPAELYELTTTRPTGNPDHPTSTAYLSQNMRWERYWDQLVQIDVPALVAGTLALSRKGPADPVLAVNPVTGEKVRLSDALAWPDPFTIAARETVEKAFQWAEDSRRDADIES